MWINDVFICLPAGELLARPLRRRMLALGIDDLVVRLPAGELTPGPRRRRMLALRVDDLLGRLTPGELPARTLRRRMLALGIDDLVGRLTAGELTSGPRRRRVAAASDRLVAMLVIRRPCGFIRLAAGLGIVSTVLVGSVGHLPPFRPLSRHLAAARRLRLNHTFARRATPGPKSVASGHGAVTGP